MNLSHHPEDFMSKLPKFVATSFQNSFILEFTEKFDRDGIYKVDFTNKKLIFWKDLLLHDVCHLLETPNLNNIKMDNFGMIGFMGEEMSIPRFFQGLVRETRAHAIQSVIDSRIIASEYTSIYNNVRGVGAIEKCGLTFPFGRFKCEQDIDAWCLDLFHKTRHQWTPKRAELELKFRLNYLENWFNNESSRNL